MLKNLPVILLILVVVYVLYTSQIGATAMNTISGLTGLKLPGHSPSKPTPADQAQAIVSQGIDLGMYDVPNPNAFGTTLEAERRMTNDGVRKEYHGNPFPYAECTCESGHCDKHGVPDPTPGQTHVCRNGFPSKRIVDMYGGHFQLNHLCAPGVEGCGTGEPAVLGRWWSRCGCSNAESAGLSVRPSCTRCG